MIRIFKLVVLLVISQVAFGQAPSNYTNINGRYRWIAGMFDSTFHIPKGSTPSLRTGGSTNSGGLFYNTSDSSVYTYTGTQWIKLRGVIIDTTSLSNRINLKLNISDTASMLNPYLRKIDTTNKYVTQVYKKNASDSVFYVKGGNHTWAFNDSTGSPGGGGGGKIYYFNGGVSMGTFGGFTMYELGDTANTGTAANFTRATTGNIANFITDPGKPGLLQIPAGVWSIDAYLKETGGGSNNAEIYVQVEKWDGSTITTIATSPIEQITNGNVIDLYTWSVSIPTTAIAVTDRIIIQFYIQNTNGKTVTLYTQNGYVGQVHTTFTTGIGAINGLTAPAQYLVTGTSGTDFNINSATATHTFNLPTASSTNRGALSSTDWTTFNNKGSVSSVATNTATGITGGTITTTGTLAIDTLLISTRAWRQKGIDSIKANYVPYTGATTNVDINTRLLSANSFKANGNGVSSGGYLGFQQFNGTTSGLSGYTILTALGQDKLFLSYAQSPTGTRTAILSSSLITTDSSYTYNFPNKGGTFAMTSDVTGAVSGTTNYIPKFTSSSAIGNSIMSESSSNINVAGSVTIQSGNALYVNNAANTRSGSLYTSADGTELSSFNGAGEPLLLKSPVGYIAMFTGGSEGMRLTSTGLGIGTSSPASKLSVGGSGYSGRAITAIANNTDYGITFQQDNANGAGLQIFTTQTSWGNTPFVIATSSSNLLTLNSSGNLGLSVTPSAWLSTTRAFQLGYGSVRSFTNSANTYLENNNYVNSSGTDIYLNNGAAGRYRIADEQHIWYQAASGTAGNAITFTQAMTLDASGRLGIGTTSPAYKLDVNNTGGSIATARLYGNDQANVRLRLENTGGRTWELTGGLTGANNSTFTIYDVTATATRLQIDASGNLGLGVTPSAWSSGFTAFQSLRASFVGQGNRVLIGANWFYDGGNKYITSDYASLYQQVESQHIWYTAPSGTAGDIISFTQAMTLFSTGNLAVGGTADNGSRLNVTGAATFSSSVTAATNITSGTGAFNTGGFFIPYSTSSASSRNWKITNDQEAFGDFSIKQSSTQTGLPDTYRLYISPVGNVGIGTTSPSTGSGAKLEVVQGTSTSAVARLVAPSSKTSTTQEYPLYITTNEAWASNPFGFEFGLKGNSTSSSRVSYIQSQTVNTSNDGILALNPNGGNVGIGTTSPTDKFVVSNGGANTLHFDVEFSGGASTIYSYNRSTSAYTNLQLSASNIIFQSGGTTERMRITSGGEVLVGKSSTSVDVKGVRFDGDGAVYMSIPNADASYYLRDITNAAYRFYVNGAGTIFATNTTISAISDIRYKENVRDLDSALNKLMLLKPRVFDWKEGMGKNIKNDKGFIAQEFEQIFPELVDKWKEKAPQGEEPYKSIRQDLIPYLVKAIQELKAEIETLKNK
jgi:hypothetical protein